MPSAAKQPAGPPPGLPRGRHSLSREQVAANQRLRIVLAMIEAAGSDGYGQSTVVDVCARAGVSRNSFYAHFEGKQDCFLTAYDAVIAAAMSRIERALSSAEGWPGRVEAAIGALFDGAAANPPAARVALVEIAAAGQAGLERRERAMTQFERFIRDGLSPAPQAMPATAPDPVLRAVVGGLSRILYTRVRMGRLSGLSELIPGLVRWAMSYHPTPVALKDMPPAGPESATGALAGGRAPGTLYPRGVFGGRRGLPHGVKHLSRSFVVHSQRERILDALANLTAQSGFAGLTVEALASDAGVSLETFYEHFESKQDALEVAYQLGHAKGLGLVERAFTAERDWREGVAAAVAALLEYLASEPAFAHIALLETLTATAGTAERADEGIAAYAQMLVPGFEQAPRRARPPAITIEAITGSLYELCFQYAAQGRTRELGELRAHATYIALAPFIGGEQAAAVAVERQPQELG
jgi:AcrR family transcriptional regulator